MNSIESQELLADMQRPKSKEYLKKVKDITLKNTFSSLLLFLIPVSGTYIARYFHLTSCNYYKINYLLLCMFISVVFFIAVILIKKDVSGFFGKALVVVQFINWLVISGAWLVIIDEIRILVLLSSFVVFIFLFSIGNFLYSILVVIIFQATYIGISYYCITYLGQSGSIKKELFHSYAFFYSVIFLLSMVQTFKKQRKRMIQARKESEQTRKNLAQSNHELSETNTKIRGLVDDISILSKMIADEAEQITSSSDSLSSGAAIQVNSIEEVSESISRIHSKTAANTDSAIEVTDLVTKAGASSYESVKLMQKMNIAVENIRDSAKAISKIINTIDGIAFQTSILALNASVEAARAGKHGKGFAVVAQEVRNLASKSADAASITTELIEKSIKKVETGVGLSKTAAVSLDDINNRITNIVDLIEDITKSGKEQNDEISNINEAMVSISQITNKNALNAHETNEASEKLSGTANKIQELLASLKLSMISLNN
jgi:methyl-accepting chemotaxis protein